MPSREAMVISTRRTNYVSQDKRKTKRDMNRESRESRERRQKQVKKVGESDFDRSCRENGVRKRPTLIDASPLGAATSAPTASLLTEGGIRVGERLFAPRPPPRTCPGRGGVGGEPATVPTTSLSPKCQRQRRAALCGKLKQRSYVTKLWFCLMC